MKDVTAGKGWIFELGVGDGFVIPTHILVGFMQKNKFIQQHQNPDAFNRPSVRKTQ